MVREPTRVCPEKRCGGAASAKRLDTRLDTDPI